MKDRFVDVLLLSIIRAYHHHGDKTEDQRLLTAREALFGEKRQRGRSSLNDEFAIFRIAAERQKPEIDQLKKRLTKINPEYDTPVQQAEFARQPLSARAASKRFLDEAPDHRGHLIDPDSKADRLRKKAREAKLTSKDMVELESIYYDDWEFSHEMNSIRIILEYLQNLQVKSDRS